MISKTHKFICICNMRVASQSLSKTLTPYCLHNDSHYTALELKTGKFTSPASIRMSTNTNVLAEFKKIWEDYFKFAFVRNPSDHFLSVYLYLKQHKAKNTECFKNYSKIQEKTNFSALSDWSFTGLFDRISDENDKIIVDFVGKHESIKEDWDFILKKVGIKKLNLLHINKSNKNEKDLEWHYTKTEKDVVKKLYKKDFEKFKYDF